MHWLLGRALISIIAVSALLPSVLVAEVHDKQQWTMIDGILATVDDVPVLLSDVQLEVDFRLLEAPGEGGAFQALLDSYLNRLLILKELEDIGGFRLTEGQAEAAYQGYRAGFEDSAVFEGKLSRWGIGEEEVYKRLMRALLVSLYTESRIKFFIKVLPSDIERAYAEDPQRWGEVGVFEAWESIKTELQNRSFEREKSRWLASLRQRYNLVIVSKTEDLL